LLYEPWEVLDEDQQVWLAVGVCVAHCCCPYSSFSALKVSEGSILAHMAVPLAARSG
jgi:hypothetical protein